MATSLRISESASSLLSRQKTSKVRWRKIKWQGWRNTRQCRLLLVLLHLRAAALRRDSITTPPLSVHRPLVKRLIRGMASPLSTTRHGHHSRSSSGLQAVRRSTARRVAFHGQAMGSSRTSTLVRGGHIRRTARQTGSNIIVLSSHLQATAAMPSNTTSRPHRRSNDRPMPPPKLYNSSSNAQPMGWPTRPMYPPRSRYTAH